MNLVTDELIDVSDTRRRIVHQEKDTLVSSNRVIHFTRSFNNLKGIIEDGFRPSECDEFPIFLQAYYEIEGLLELLQKKAPTIECRQVPVVCFCDLTKQALMHHKSRYGYYGVGLSKSWAISNYLSPLLYIPKDTSTHSTLYSIVNLSERIINLNIQNENPEVLLLVQQIYRLLDFIKPYQDFRSNQKYYDEREWRYVPNRFFDPKNPETYLKFDNDDIEVIYVMNIREKREVCRILEKHGKHFDTTRILLSRKK